MKRKCQSPESMNWLSYTLFCLINAIKGAKTIASESYKAATTRRIYNYNYIHDNSFTKSPFIDYIIFYIINYVNINNLNELKNPFYAVYYVP